MEKITKKPFLIAGDILHSRLHPKKNFFRYKSTYICFPITKKKLLKKLLFSLNRFNLFGFYSSDYGDKNSTNITNWITKILKDQNIKDVANIVLITHPRVLGNVFNPVSFWLCLDKKNQLIAVLSEVNNTAGQKHSYLCFQDGLAPIKSNDWLEAKKNFYVSPFLKVEGNYKFRFVLKEDKIDFFINYLVGDKLKLSTSLKCQLLSFTNKRLILSFFKTKLFPFKTTFLIHYQAVKLYFKSIKYYKYPKAIKLKLTSSKKKK